MRSLWGSWRFLSALGNGNWVTAWPRRSRESGKAVQRVLALRGCWSRESCRSCLKYITDLTVLIWPAPAMGVRPACGKLRVILLGVFPHWKRYKRRIFSCVIITLAKAKALIMFENAVRNLGCLRRTLKSFPGRSSSVLAERGSWRTFRTFAR